MQAAPHIAALCVLVALAAGKRATRGRQRIAGLRALKNHFPCPPMRCLPRLCSLLSSPFPEFAPGAALPSRIEMLIQRNAFGQSWVGWSPASLISGGEGDAGDCSLPGAG